MYIGEKQSRGLSSGHSQDTRSTWTRSSQHTKQSSTKHLWSTICVAEATHVAHLLPKSTRKTKQWQQLMDILSEHWKGFKEKRIVHTLLFCGAACAWRFCMAEPFLPGFRGSSQQLHSPWEPQQCASAQLRSQAWKEKKKEKAGNVHKSGYSDYAITINACTCMAKCWKGACSNLRWQNGSTCSQGKHLFNLLLFFFKQQTADKQPIPLWLMAIAKFPLISEAGPNNKQEKGHS